MPDNNDIDNELQRAITSILKAVNAGKTVSDAQLRDFLSNVGKTSNGLKDVEYSAKGVASAFKNTASSMAGFAGQLGRGNTAFSVVNTAVRGVSDGLGSLAKMIPIVGDGIAGLIGEAGKAAEFSVEQIEAGYGAFGQLSDIGLIGSKGIKGLAEDFAEAGIPLKMYTGLLSNSSKQLAALTGTAHDASGVFAETMGQLRGETKKGINGIDSQMRLLGYSTAEIGETFINYADLQRRLGREQSMNSQSLKDGTAEYAKELDIISKLTGMSRKEQQKVVDAAMAESRWRATIQDMNPKQVQQMNNLNNGLSAFSGELAQGMRDQASGFTQSDAAQRLFRSTNGESARIQQRLNSGQITGIEALQQYQNAIKNNMDPMKSLAKATGNQAGIYTDYSKNMDFVTASMTELDKATKTQTAQTKSPDDITKGATKAVVALEDANTKIASMFMNSDNAATALEKFASATNMAAEAAFNLFLDKNPINAARNATGTEIAKQQLLNNKTQLADEYKSLGNAGFGGMTQPKDEASRQRMAEIVSEVDDIDKRLADISTKIEKERINRVKSTASMFEEFGLGKDYFKQFSGAAKHKDGWAGFQGIVESKVLGKGMNMTQVEPAVMNKAKNLISASGRSGEALMAPTTENKELWNKVNEILSRFNAPEVDYNPNKGGIQNNIPVEIEQNNKAQTDALNNMGAKLDKIAYNTNKLVTKTEQLVSTMA